MNKATERLAEIAEKYGMITLMANGVGQADDFECDGRSAVWDRKGTLVGQLNHANEGILVFDTETHRIFKKTI